jgi:hypothetical protein
MCYAALRYLDISIGTEGPQIFQTASERGLDVTVGASLEGAVGGARNYGLKLDAAGYGLSRRRYESAPALGVSRSMCPARGRRSAGSANSDERRNEISAFLRR